MPGRYSENIEEVSARTMTLFYLFDKSGSMAGTKIAQVNYAMKDIPKIVKEIADGAPNAKIEVAAAAFSTDVEWITPAPQSPDDFINTWHDISAGGLTSLGAALRSLNEKLSRKMFLGSNPLGYLAPGIIILSDGAPTDDWQEPLRALRENNWFKNAVKIAFAIGEASDFEKKNRDVLAEICGSSEAVISISDADKIRDYIKFVTATVSKSGTMSQTSMSASAQENVIQQIKERNEPNTFVVDIPDVDDSQW